MPVDLREFFFFQGVYHWGGGHSYSAIFRGCHGRCTVILQFSRSLSIGMYSYSPVLREFTIGHAYRYSPVLTEFINRHVQLFSSSQGVYHWTCKGILQFSRSLSLGMYSYSPVFREFIIGHVKVFSSSQGVYHWACTVILQFSGSLSWVCGCHMYS